MGRTQHDEAEPRPNERDGAGFPSGAARDQGRRPSFLRVSGRKTAIHFLKML
jgi:hypothetical protein